MTDHVSGPFEVKMTPQAPSPLAGEAGVGRMSLDKAYHGDLEATGKGEMLAFRSPVDGSAGYVALEKVSGMLQGRTGSFVIQHHGIMDRGKPGLSILVVPDSADGELTGLSGSMHIEVAQGRHTYRFDYTLPDGG